MKTNLTIGVIRTVTYLIAILFSLNLFSQSITVSNETFPNTFNTSFGTTNNSNGTFVGSIGTWTGSSNTNAAVAVIPAYYSPVTNAIKIVNWNTTGKTFGECAATSPTVNLSSYNCTSAMNLQFKLYTYTCNSADINTQLHLEFSTNNGSTWTSVYSRSSAQIFNTWGANAITTINVPVDQAYRLSTFKYRFRGYKPGGQGNDFFVFIDDVKILADACPSVCNIGGVNLGGLTNYLFVFTNGNSDANWQSASKGFVGNVAVDGIQASERTSGSFAYAGTISTNDASLNAWASIVSNNSGQAFSSLNQTSLLSGLETDLNNVFTQINALPVSTGYNGIAPTALNGLNTTNGVAQTFVINVNSGFGVSSQINITGDAGDIFILRWDTDMNFSNGYQGQVKFQSGGAIVPLGGLKPSNFIHVAGDINASGGGSTPPAPYPQGPRYNNGTGALITGGADFSGGGFFTGYWFTTGDPANGQTASLSNGIFVGGWYSTTNKFSMTSGTSGVYVAPVCSTPVCTGEVTSLYFNKLDGGTDLPITNGSTFTTSQLGNLYNLEVGTTGTIGSVKFSITGPTPSSNIENAVPYNSPGTGSGAWTGAPGNYSVNIKVYNGADATGTLCDEMTVTFTLIDNNCSCPGNIVLNPSFESGTTNWNWSGGTLAQGTGGIACGSYSGDLNNTSATSKAWQNIGTNLPFGTTVTASVYAGTHDNTFNNWVAIEFLDGSGVVLGSSVYVQVDKILANAPAGPQLYNINATVPLGAVTTRVAFGGNGSYTKTDLWCVTLTVPTGSIGDRVWFDANGNGIQDATETGGITGVTVQLRNSAGTVIATTTTNGSGNYLFSNLPAGNYTVAFPVSISGAVVTTPNVGTNDDIDSDPSQSTGITPTIVLGAGQTITNVDAGYCPTTLVLGNFVWNDQNNNGVQDAGEPGINGVTVNLYKDNDANNVPDGPALATTTTNASGNYSFSSLAPGNYIVGVVIPSGYNTTSTTATSTSPNNDNNTDNNGVNVVSGELRSNFITLSGGGEPTNDGDGADGNLTLDFGLRATGSIGDRVWNDVNRNGIQDAGELGLAGVTVSLYDNSNNLIGSTVTDAYGNYKFDNLPVSAAGINYQIQFSQAEGYAFSPTNADAAGVSGANNSDANATTGRTGNINLTVAAPNVTYVDAGMYLTQPNRIGDFIWNDLNKDGDQDAGEPGIAGVVVTLYDNAGNPVRTTITDNNGRYEFTDVPNGTYSIGVTPPPGYQFSPADQASGDDTKDSDINPATGRTAAFTFTGGTNLTLDAGLNVTPATKASVGDFVWADLDNDNVQDANEPGIAGVTVQLYNSANTLIATTTTNALGYYVFNNVDPGSYYVKFSNTPAGYNFVTADAGTDDTKDSDVTGANGAGTTATFTLVADQNNMTLDAGIRRTTALNSLGDFVWYDLDKDGVQDAGEAGVPGVTATLYDAATGATLKSTTTNAQGLYMFTDLAAGSYTVGFTNMPTGYAFSPTGAGTSATDSDPNPNTGRTGTVTIAGTGNVITTVDAGIVSNPNTFDTKASIGDYVWNDINNNGIQDAGEPGIPGVTVTLYAADGTTVIATTTTDALGSYQFANLNAGTYVVGFSGFPAGYALSTLPNAGGDDSKDSDADPVTGKTGPVTLLPGQINITIDAALRNPAVLARLGNYVWNDVNGNGFQDAGEPGVPGVSVFLLDNAGNIIKNTVTDANGLYMFTDLAAGTYKVRFGNLPSGFIATTKDALPANDNTDSDADPVTLTTDNIVLAAGAADMTWDLGIRSTTTASIGDYVWSDVNGNGQQDAGEPGVAGVLVTLYNSAGTAIASTVTDANGKYLFVNVAPGSYTVGFSGIPSGSVFTTKDNGADATDSDVNPGTGRTDAFALVAGQANMTIDAGLVTNYAAVGNYVWQDVNRNGIQDAGEPPVAGVTVILYNSANQPVASAVTDGNGYYFINNIPVPAGGANYTIGFTDIPSGNVFTTKNAAGSTNENDSNADTGTGLTDVFGLSQGQIRLDIDAGLIKLINISGNVWHDVNGMTDNLVNNTGPLQLPPAAPIPPVLRAYLVNFSTGLVEKVAFVNPANGTFVFGNVTPNTNYYIVVSGSLGIVGAPPPVSALPSGWEHTGQKLGITSGSDGLNDGRLIVPVGTTDVINANFGIRLRGGDIVVG